MGLNSAFHLRTGGRLRVRLCCRVCESGKMCCVLQSYIHLRYYNWRVHISKVYTNIQPWRKARVQLCEIAERWAIFFPSHILDVPMPQFALQIKGCKRYQSTFQVGFCRTLSLSAVWQGRSMKRTVGDRHCSTSVELVFFVVSYPNHTAA